MSHLINLFTPEARSNPYPIYATMRDAPPQRVEPGGVWAISRYEDVLFALKHTEIFSSSGFDALYKPSWLPYNPLGDSLVTKDGTGHSRLRALVIRAFSPQNIARFEPRIRQIAAECAEALRTDSQCDFVERFAVPLPARIIAELLGLEGSLHKRFREWVDLIAAISPAPPPEEVIAALRTAVADMERYFKEVIDARRAAPAGDVVSDLIVAELDGVKLTDEEIIAFLFVLLPAGFETTRQLLAHILRIFLEQPELYEKLRADRSLIPDFVEEALRYEPPVHGVFRIIMQDVEMGGVKLPAGAMAMILVGSAGRDGEQYPEADRFNIHREGANHLSFGHGVHFCLGAPLARLEGRVAVEELIARYRGFERGEGEVAWNMAPTARGPNNLPVRVLGE